MFEAVRKCLESGFKDKRQKNMRYLFIREDHEDGGSHLHCYIEFDGTKFIIDRKQLNLSITAVSSDFEKQITFVYEGNYQSCKNKGACIQYMAKSLRNSRDVFSNFKRLPVLGDMYFDTVEEHLYHVLKTKGLNQALDVLYKDYGEIAVKRASSIKANLENINEFLQQQKLDESISVLPLSDFKGVPEDVFSWMRKNKRKNKTTLMLYGPTATGKTELAKAICGDLK